MKTLAELKRTANSRTVEARIIFHSGWTEGLPERLLGWRRLVRANSVSIFFEKDGKESELRIRNAKLTEYTGTSLTIYKIGQRDLTEEERKAMDEWEALEKTIPPYESAYWRRKDFYKKRGMEHLLDGYDFNTGKVRDAQVRGEIDIQYELRTVA